MLFFGTLADFVNKNDQLKVDKTSNKTDFSFRDFYFELFVKQTVLLTRNALCDNHLYIYFLFLGGNTVKLQTDSQQTIK